METFHQNNNNQTVKFSTVLLVVRKSFTCQPGVELTLDSHGHFYQLLKKSTLKQSRSQHVNRIDRHGHFARCCLACTHI